MHTQQPNPHANNQTSDHIEQHKQASIGITLPTFWQAHR
jgi:hypothetical protein